MKTLDILALPKSEASLSIIKSYLQTQLPVNEYEVVFLHMLEMELELGLYQNVITEGEELLTTFTNSDSGNYPKVIKLLFDASLNNKDYDRSIYYLDLHKKHVPILEEYIVKMDEIKLTKLLNKPYFELLVSMTREPAPNDIKIPYYEELIHYLLERDRFAEAKDFLEELFNITDKKYYKEELTILLGLELYDELIKKAQEYKNIPEASFIAVISLLKTYRIHENYHQMTILDSDYSTLFEEAPLEEKREFYEILVEFYKTTKRKLNEDFYANKLKQVKRLETKQIKQEKPTKEQTIQAELTEVRPRYKKGSISSSEEKRQISNFFDILMFSENINEKFSLRDFLRTLFIYLDNYIKPLNYVVYLTDGRLFNYKKERLYDKRIISELINNTIVKNIIDRNQEYFSNPLDFEKNIEIVSQLPYLNEIKYVYGFPLDDIGALLVYFDEEVLDPEIYYDFIKLVSGIVFSKINREDKLKKFRKENLFLTNILRSNLIALRTLSETKTIYNTLAQKLFNQEEHDYVDHFIINLKQDQVRGYRDLLRKMFSKPSLVEKTTYQYKNKYIEERLISVLDDEQIKVVSAFQDITDIVLTIESSKHKAITDPETNLYNINHLKEEMLELLKTKVTFMSIELNLDNRHLYGPDKTLIYFKEFARITDNFFIDGITYRSDFNELIITIPYNDIRAIKNLLKEYIKHITEYEVISLPYEQFSVKMGVLRYPVVTNNSSVDKILKFLDIAKEKSKLRKDYFYHQFSYSDYEEEVFEQNVLTYLNESLEKRNLSLNFSQIIDVEKNLVWQYKSQIVIPDMHIDPSYLIKIAKKRNRIIDLERYHIIRVLDYLTRLSNETKMLIRITIPISEQTFVDSTFNSFLIGAIKDRKVPFSFIRLKIDLTNIKTHHYAHKIHELINTGIALDTTALAMALTYPFNALYIDFNDSDIKWQTYYRELCKTLNEFHIALIAKKIDSREHLNTINRLGIKYVTGSLYPDIDEEQLFKQILDLKKNNNY